MCVCVCVCVCACVRVCVYFYHSGFSDYCFNLYFNIHNISANGSSGHLQVFVYLIYIYIYIYIVVVDRDPKAPFFISYDTTFPGLLFFTLDMYLIVLSIKRGGIKYHFLSLWYDSTWD